MRKIYFITLAMGIYFFAFISFCGADPNYLRINCTIHSPYEAFFLRLVEEICSLNNILIKHNTPPVGRSLINVDQGIDDGDGPRIGGLSSIYPNLICVPEPFGDFTFGAFAKAKNIKIDGWSSLCELNVAYIHGWKIFDRQVTSAKSISKVKDKELLFGLLDSNRTDVVLITKITGYAAIHMLNLKDIRFVEPPLAVEPNFLYLHKRHKAFVTKLSEDLKDLKRDGTYDRLYHQIVSPYLPR